jgi:hypothetical protein
MGWMHMVRAGPVEEEVIELILTAQREDRATKALLLQSSILAYPHTREAYESFVNDERSSHQLWKHILTHEPPEKITPIHAFYQHDGQEYTEEELHSFDLVFSPQIKHTQAAGTVDTHNDIFDFMPWKTYGFRKYRTEYVVVDRKKSL